MKTSAKKNFIYNIIYEILVLILPLISAPYVSRVIGADGLGTYSYTYSICYYFMLLTLLGVNNYGNRSIAKVRDNKAELSKTFWSIYSFQLLMGIVMLLSYIGFVLVFDNIYKTIALIQSLHVISALLNINWLFFGLEEFKITVTRNSIIKILSLILIFVFVKHPGDLWKYTLILSGMTVLSQLILWSQIKGRITFYKVKLNDVVKHIKPNIILFIPIIAISLYKIMDKIMLGSMTSVTEVGYYENAEKMINIPLTVITALGTVMLPKISNIVSNGDKSLIEQYINKSINFVMFLSFAMCFGLIAIGYNFAPLFFGKEFQKTGVLIMFLATTLPFLSFANVLRTQYLIPNEMDKEYIISVGLGAVINLIMNAIFIPRYLSIGACFGTVAAEFMVMFYQAYVLRNKLPIKKYIKEITKYLWKAIVMFAIVFCMNFINTSSYLKLVIQLVFGIGIYALLNYNYIKSNVNLKEIFHRVRKN